MPTKNRINSILFTVFLSLLIMPLNISASGDSGNSTALNDNDKILESIQQRHNGAHSIKATVYQDKRIMALKEPIHVKGTIILQKPGMLKWETESPEESVTVIDDKTITVYYPNAKEAEIRQLSDHLIARNTLNFLGSVMWGSFDNMRKRFDLEISRKDDEIILKLTPSSIMAARYISSITIHYDDQAVMLKSFEMMTPKGDRTSTTLEDIIINPDINDKTFKLDLPADVIVRDLSKTVDDE